MTSSPSNVDEPARRRLEAALRAGIAGDVNFDAGTRAAYARDSSNYRHIPHGVTFPRTAGDVSAILRICAEHDVAVLARGAGTSLAGQASNVAVIVDTSRYLTRILNVDAERRTARVEPGVVLDDLRRAAEAHGLTFGPDPATHAWCTIGGMIGNNACGTHSLFAGKTVDNVERLQVALYGGAMVDFGAYDRAALTAAVIAGGTHGRILRELAALGERYAGDVAHRFPTIPRRISGYNLDQIVPGSQLHAARALVGTESTCVIVTEATVRLIESPPQRRLVVIGFDDVFAAADAVAGLLRHDLLALEGFDGTLIEQMRARAMNRDDLALLPPGGAWLIAEVGAITESEAAAKATEVVETLGRSQSWRLLDAPEDQRRMWLVRDSALGATTRTLDGRHNYEGWEDGAVAPAQLGTYLRRLAELWREFGYSGAWYGHFGQGCVHTRNDFDLGTPHGLRAYRDFVERAADLVVSLGGSLSGEHGDGQSRGELLERMYGQTLVGAFREFKSIFDPTGRMNPGRVVDARPLDADLRYGPSHRTSSLRPTYLAFSNDAGSMQLAAERCVGVGRCRRDDAGTMCPSYRATRDERHSTRGRANLLAEMFQGEITADSWRNEDVRAALDLCLSCKGCAVDCPTGVDMATYKAEFMAHYYERKLRPRAMYALGLSPWTLRVGSRLPRAANLLLGESILGRTVRRAAGITTRRRSPMLGPRTWRRGAIAHGRAMTDEPTVVVWPDTFTDLYRPEVGDDLVATLEAFGERVVVPRRWGCCGRPLFDAGMLGMARRSLRGILDILEPWLIEGLPVIVPEPSCLAVFRDELSQLLPGDTRAARLAALARSPAEHLLAVESLDEVLERAATEATDRVASTTFVVHPHCHARAIGSSGADSALLSRIGLPAQMLDAGCCGLAGSFGFRSEHEQISRAIGESYWLPRVSETLERAGGDAVFVTDGFSCMTQAETLGGPPAVALISVVRGLVVGDRASP